MIEDIDERLRRAREAAKQQYIINGLLHEYDLPPQPVKTLDDLCTILESLITMKTKAPEGSVLFARAPEWPHEPFYWSDNFEQVAGFGRQHLSGEGWLTLTEERDKEPLKAWIQDQNGFPLMTNVRHPLTDEPFEIISVLRHVRERGPGSDVIALIGWFRRT